MGEEITRNNVTINSHGEYGGPLVSAIIYYEDGTGHVLGHEQVLRLFSRNPDLSLLGEEVPEEGGFLMACPKCECRETYGYYEDDMDSDTTLERCAACGYIFDIEEALDEEE